MSREGIEDVFLGWMLADESLAWREDPTSPQYDIRAADERALNAAAHFLLLFAQFEAAVDAAFVEWRGNPVGHAFEWRVRELLDAGDAEVVLEFYADRNDLAHGRVLRIVALDLASRFAILRRLALHLVA